MSDKLIKLIENNDIQRVLVIDDAYDDYPLAEDLSRQEDQWSNFFNDLEDEQINQISSVYPNYMQMGSEDLMNDNEFIKTIWDIYIRSPKVEPFKNLFEQYHTDKNNDKNMLNPLINKLINLNLNVTTLGRSSLTIQNEFDIIIVDLYLNNIENSIDNSVEKIKSILTSYKKTPLLILMSRSTRLGEKSKEFREKTGSIESMFRIIEKGDLKNNKKLDRILKDLIENKEHSYNILKFIQNWEKGIENAAQRSINILKNLDIAEYTKIKQLVLNAEGESTGNYIVDVMHHILQYELENDKAIIDSSKLLNRIDSDYLPRIHKGTNLQEIVERLHCKNIINISDFSSETRIHFGDILTINNLKIVKKCLRNYTLNNSSVMLVISPACDLQRCNDFYNVIFLKGEMEMFTIKKWVPKADSSQIVKIENNFYIISWDIKNPFTVSYKYIVNNLTNNNLKISARLREIPSLSLQQESLSKMGRVGVIAPMPASYNLDLSFYYITKNNELEKINIELNEYCFSTLFTSPRVTRNKNLNKLIISNELCEKLHDAIDSIDVENIHQKSRKAFNIIKNDLFFEAISKNGGIQVPFNSNDCPIKVEIEAENKTNEIIIGYVTNRIIEESTNKKVGLIICLNTQE